MNTSLRFRIITMSLFALVAFGFASKTFAKDFPFRKIVWTYDDGTSFTVDVAKDGSFITPALKAGRIKVQFFWDRRSSVPAAGKSATLTVTGNPGGSPAVSQDGIGRGIGSPMGGSSDRESSAPSVSEITMTYQVQALSDAQGGMGGGKVTFNPFSITKKLDKASPMIAGKGTSHSMDIGNITIEADCAGITGKIILKDQYGKVMASDDWMQTK